MRDKKTKIQGAIPLEAVGIETERENNDFTHMPPQRYIHVWFARRPTPVSRLAVLTSVISEDVDDDTLLQWMEMDPNNRSPGTSISNHIRDKRESKDQRNGAEYEHFGYRKIWRKTPKKSKISEIHSELKQTWDGELPTVLDATAGAGSIPMESVRYDLPTIANEYNPVASVILKSVLQHPRVDGDLSDDILKWGERINKQVREELSDYFPNKQAQEPMCYFWANEITCPDCGLEIPLTTNWWLDRDSSREGVASRPLISGKKDSVEFEVVNLPDQVEKEEFDPSDGTIQYGKATCPRCNVTIESEEIKNQAADGGYGQKLYAVRYQRKSSSSRPDRGYRSPTDEDIEAYTKAEDKIESSPELSTFLNTDIPDGSKTNEAIRNGITQWRDFFNKRQLLAHHTYYQAFESLKPRIREEHPKAEADVILTFLSLAADKSLDYNCRLNRWHASRSVLGNAFAGSDFAFSWSYPENNLLAEGVGYEWALNNVLSAYEDLVDLIGDSESDTTVLQNDAADMDLDDCSVDTIVLDPPYYQNIMYAEISDFFYIWMDKYLGDVYPQFFSENLTDKYEEAVANPSIFEEVSSEDRSQADLARDHYEDKMSEIFSELYRVLDGDGIFTMMFTHKETEAWDTLTKALIQAGFTVTNTHPINSEDPHRIRMSSKNSAESTILMVSEKREQSKDEYVLWQDIAKETKKVARERAESLETSDLNIARVDIILAAYGPALEVFTQNYPVVDDEGNEVSPETALDEAREAVRDYLIEKYLNEGITETDPKTEWYVLAWLIFEAQRFPYDEARRLAIGVGEDLDTLKKTHRMWRKKSGDVLLRPHEDRVQDILKNKDARSGRKPVDPEALSFSTALDKVHALLHIYDKKGATEAWNWMSDRNCGSDPEFKATLEALLRVLPYNHSDWELSRDVAVGDTGELLDLQLDAGIFGEQDQEHEQGNLTDF